MTTTKVAPVLTCVACQKPIGKKVSHALTSTLHVLHNRCIGGDHTLAYGRRVHALTYPDCPHEWHDMYDHRYLTGTRAGIAHQLGLWGKQPADRSWREGIG